MSHRKEIVLVSGVAPIFADKVRAWKEPLLAKRIGKAPVPPKVELTTSDVARAPDLPNGASERPLEVADMADLHKLEFEDFESDFSAIEIPSRKLTEAETSELADRFLESVSARSGSANERNKGD